MVEAQVFVKEPEGIFRGYDFICVDVWYTFLFSQGGCYIILGYETEPDKDFAHFFF